MGQKLLNRIFDALSRLENSGKIKKMVKKAVDEGIPVEEIIGGLRKGLEEVGRRYEAGEYFLSELLFSAALMKDAMEVLAPRIGKEGILKNGKIVLATVRGDMHDIGKNIFKMLAEASGFEVHDMGVDVEPSEIIQRLEETKADILALSALLTTTRNEMKVVVDFLIEKEIRRSVRVLLGGNAVTKEFAREIAADEAALDAVEGVEICKRWVKME